MTSAKDPGWRGLTLSGSSRVQPGALSEPLRRAVAELVLDTTVEGIWLIDANARTTFVNRRLTDLLGYTEDEMIGRPVFDFLDRRRWPIAARNLEQRALGIEERQEVQLTCKDGRLVWMLASANPVFDADGNYAGALALLGDLSAQKERERSLRAEIAALRSRLPPASAGAAHDSATVRPAVREPFRTALVLGVLATLTATIAVVTAGAVVSDLLRPGGDREAEG
jgi:PAS domain S-box-containing protein